MIPHVGAALITEILPQATHGDEVGAAEDLATLSLLMDQARAHQRRQMMGMSGSRHPQTTLQIADGQALIPGPHQQANKPKSHRGPQCGQPVRHPRFDFVLAGRYCLHT